MSTERVRQVQRIFDDAAPLASEARATLLDEACGSDEALRAEVASLLLHSDQAGLGFMRPPLAPGPRVTLDRGPDVSDPLVGRRIGGHLIQRVIATGGMGTVYLARQERPDREVAVKVMHASLTAQQARRRFDHESEVLARLGHPNIAQIFEAGVHAEAGCGGRGIPFFVMEYIPGARTLTDHARLEQLNTVQRLKLFAEVCAGVHHGHRKGIIHRDLKPANILVDGEGHVKVIDFGVARSTDSDVAVTTMHTDVGMLLGTVAYMSPEQCEADPLGLDVRSDVYSLGVVLYELLCGQLPYGVKHATIFEATRIIREQPPTRPSTITRRKDGARVAQISGDLETLILTALEKDREKRYQSAADLAADIQRYLNHEPIAARAPTSWTRALRWVGRHPKMATLATCLAIVGLVAGSTRVVYWFAYVRPDRVEIVANADGVREARLLTLGGDVLKSWKPKAPGYIASGEIVDRPKRLGGGRLVILAFHDAYGLTYPHSLCAFDADDPDRLVWESHLRNDEPLPISPEPGRRYVGADFSPGFVVVADVFPEAEGEPPANELVVPFSCEYSENVLRIYDLTGKPLYQVWQQGGIHDVYWMSEPRLLVCLAADEEFKRDPAFNHLDDIPHVPYVFAVAPRRDSIEAGFVSTSPGDGPLNPVWVKYFLPVMSRDQMFLMEFVPPKGRHQPARSAVIRVHARDADEGVNIALDQHGEETDRVVSDAYIRHQDLHPPGDPERLPDPHTGFYFGAQPPRTPPPTTAPAGS